MGKGKNLYHSRVCKKGGGIPAAPQRSGPVKEGEEGGFKWGKYGGKSVVGGKFFFKAGGVATPC